MKQLTLAALAALLLTGSPALAADNSHGAHGGHGAMKMDTAASDEAEVKAKINTIDAAAGNVNVTHDPVPALNWPAMTMDIPVTKRVDLSTVKPGDDVVITLKKGRDEQYRITEIAPAK